MGESRPGNRPTALPSLLFATQRHSPEDVWVTAMLAAAGKLLDIVVLDFIVIGRSRFVRLKEPA